MTRSYFKDSKKEQYYNLLRNHTGEKISVKNAQSPQIHRQPSQKSAETSSPRNQAKSSHLTRHKETSQPISKANQLTGFQKRQAPT